MEKQFIKDSLIFIIVFCILLLLVNSMFGKPNSSNANGYTYFWEYVNDENCKPIDILFLGHSHTFRTFDSQVMSESLDLNIRSLGHSAGNGKICISMLEALLKHTVPGTVCVECSIFGTNEGQYTTMKTTSLGVVYSHIDNIPEPFERLKFYTKNVYPNDIPAGLFPVLRPTEMWKRYALAKPVTVKSYWYYGYDPRTNYQSGSFNAKDIELKHRNIKNSLADSNNMYSENRESLNKLLSLAGKYNFDIWFVLSPTMSASSYSNVYNDVTHLVETNPHIKVSIDLMDHLTDMGMEGSDFFDEGHVNRNGAEKITEYMIQFISDETGVDIHEPSSAILKHDQQIALDNGFVRYEVEAWSDCLYSFQYKDLNNTTVKTDFSEMNYIDLDPGCNPTKISVRILPKSNPDTEPNTYLLCLPN